MALGPDPTPHGRPAKARPAARARVVATVGSVGAVVGITAGIALNAPSSDAETGAAPQQAPSTSVSVPAAPEEGRERDDWWERVVDRDDEDHDDEDHDDEDHDDEDHDDESWWERAGDKLAEELRDDEDDGWRAPSPGPAPQSQQPASQTRSAGS